MQLILLKTVLAPFVLIGILTGIALGTGLVRVVEAGSPQLALAPHGYSYSEEPFTGLIYQFRKAQPGEILPLAKLTFLIKGQFHGPDIQWHDNGQRSVERHYRNGLESGVHKAWFPDGSAHFLKSFEQGIPHGEFYDWHGNGQLAQYVLYDHGREVAAKSWTAGGKPFYNYVWRDESPVGVRGDTYCSPRKN